MSLYKWKGHEIAPIHLFSSLTRWPILQWAAPFLFVSNCTGGQQCHRFSELFQKEAAEKTDAGYSVCTDFFTKAPKEERHCTTEGYRKKGEMVGLESVNGQVWICMIQRFQSICIKDNQVKISECWELLSKNSLPSKRRCIYFKVSINSTYFSNEPI